jgi:YgiT-type zinc finger domain-containing protein
MEKEVEKLLKGGVHTAVLTVRADVCVRCGERLYSSVMIRRFEQIRGKLERQEVAEFKPIGQTFQVTEGLYPTCGYSTWGPRLIYGDTSGHPRRRASAQVRAHREKVEKNGRGTI